MPLDPVSTILDIGGKVIDRLWPNPAERDAAKAKLVELQQNGELAVMANETSLVKIAAEDRDSARAREIAVKDKIPAILAILVTVGFFATLAYVLTTPAKDVPQLAFVLVGSLGTAWTAILNYYFGSSSSSDRKTELLGAAVPKSPAVR